MLQYICMEVIENLVSSPREVEDGRIKVKTPPLDEWLNLYQTKHKQLIVTEQRVSHHLVYIKFISKLL